MAILARNSESLERARTTLPEPDKHLCLVADVSSTEELDKAMQQVHAHFGNIDILVNNAGGPAAGPLLDAQPEAFEAALRTHVLAQLHLCKKITPSMKQKRFGRIINVISTSVRTPIANLGVSNTIRAAVAGFAKTLSNELAPFGITVNNVLPGYTETERLTTLAQTAALKNASTPDAVREQWLKQVPMNRFAQPEEVAAALAFLASREASYITGVNLQVDGGRIGSI